MEGRGKEKRHALGGTGRFLGGRAASVVARLLTPPQRYGALRQGVYPKMKDNKKVIFVIIYTSRVLMLFTGFERFFEIIF
ncbi:hypothetical protein B2K_19300 [Paenibacillus mucilaginosus K02]|uniref:Uncharacterized protein n=1 Tax=Paenibacillus mucilaginosus K02 TaxID=997761 RepID=I0BKD8_9BACL|nr:hypothetical protein B2K_19300 [Paenibacillus mucilaginosus K02]